MAISLIKVLAQKVITDVILDEEKRNTTIAIIIGIVIICLFILLIPLYIILTPFENIKLDLAGGFENEYDIIQEVKENNQVIIDKSELIFEGGVLPLPIKRCCNKSIWYAYI